MTRGSDVRPDDRAFATLCPDCGLDSGDWASTELVERWLLAHVQDLHPDRLAGARAWALAGHGAQTIDIEHLGSFDIRPEIILVTCRECREHIEPPLDGALDLRDTDAVWAVMSRLLIAHWRARHPLALGAKWAELRARRDPGGLTD